MALKIGIGFSQHENAAKAAEEAAKMAKNQINVDRLDLAIVLTTPQHDPEKIFPIIQASLNQTRVIGGTTAGIILKNSVHKYGVAVFAFRSDIIKMQPIHSSHLNLKNLKEAGESFVKDSSPDFGKKDRKFLMFFFDGLLENMSEFNLGIQKELSEYFPVVAGGTSDSFMFLKTTQYHDKPPSSHSACGVIFGGNTSIHLARCHGWKPLGKPRLIKKAKKNIIEKIGDAPAIQIYEEFFKDSLGSLKNDVFGSLNGRYPLGLLVKHKHEYSLRNVMDILEDGSIVCQDSVETGSEVHIMIGNKSSCLQSVSTAVADIKKAVGDSPIKALFVLESAARWQILKHAWKEELTIISDALGSNFPIMGMLTYGEIFNPGTLQYPDRNSLVNGNIILIAVV